MRGNFGFRTFSVGFLEANCTIVWDGSGKALVVDPGDEPETILAFLEAERLDLAGIFLTHGHFDHISGVDGILARHAVPVAMHRADEELAFSPFNRSITGYGGMERTALLDLSPADGEPLAQFPLARVLHTPGHSPGSCCLHFEDEKLLIAGDTLFAGSIGRTDLPGGSAGEIVKSLARLAALPEDTSVVCGHGPSTTIGREKASNPYLEGAS